MCRISSWLFALVRLSEKEVDEIAMDRNDWVTVGEYPDVPTLRIATAILTTMKIPYRIWPETSRGLAQCGQPIILYVAPDLAEDAKRIIAGSEIPDTELTALALASPPPDDA